MNKVFLLNAFTQKVEAIYLDSLTSSQYESIEAAKEFGEVIGNIGSDLLIRVIKSDSLSITIDKEKKYEGGIFIVSNERVNNASSLHIPLFNSINFNVSLTKELYRLARNSYYQLNDRILYNNDQEHISIRDFIVQINKKSNKEKLILFYKMYANNEMLYSEKELFTFGNLIDEVLS